MSFSENTLKIKNFAYPNETAIVHDWFLNKSIGGAEKVTKVMYETLSDFSNPDIYSLVSNLDTLDNCLFKNKKINTSFLQYLPFGKDNIQFFLPLLPFAIEQFNLLDYKIILSSSHAVAKGVITGPNQLHISYVHTPMRYAWDQMHVYLNQSKLSRSGFEPLIRYFLYKIRQWDYLSGYRPDYLISNSVFTSNRIKKYWGRDSTVIHPPVEVSKFKYNLNRDDFYLSVCRLVPNKRVDLLIKAFNKLDLNLYIVGEGPEKSKLQKIAKSNIKFLGKTSDKGIEKLMSTCRAFVYAGVEDFGITIIEAMASGSPVIGFAQGGIVDSVNCLLNGNNLNSPTGILFKDQSVQSLVDTLNYFEDSELWRKFKSEDLNRQAQKFSTEKFKRKFIKFFDATFDKFNKNH